MPRTHGHAGGGSYREPLYRVWLAIRNRCNNPRTPDYRYYGGRGIRVCPQWDDFVRFAADVGPHPGKGWTFDRRDNDGDYELDNVRWATRQTQARNRGYCKLTMKDVSLIRSLYDYGGYSQDQIAKQFGVTQSHVSHILLGRTWV